LKEDLEGLGAMEALLPDAGVKCLGAEPQLPEASGVGHCRKFAIESFYA